MGETTPILRFWSEPSCVVDPDELKAADTIVRAAGWDVRYHVHLYDHDDGALAGVVVTSLDAARAMLPDSYVPFPMWVSPWITTGVIPRLPPLTGPSQWEDAEMREQGIRVFPVLVMTIGLPHNAWRRAESVSRFALARLAPTITGTPYPKETRLPALSVGLLHGVQAVDDANTPVPFNTYAGVLEGTPESYRHPYRPEVDIDVLSGTAEVRFAGASYIDVNGRVHTRDAGVLSIGEQPVFPEATREAEIYHRLYGSTQLQAVFEHEPRFRRATRALRDDDGERKVAGLHE